MGRQARACQLLMTITKSFRQIVRRPSLRVLVAGALALVLMDRGAGPRTLQAQSGPNLVSAENGNPGDSDWDLPAGDAGDPDIQGFATDISTNIGKTVYFKIAAPGAASYQIAIYRL